MNQKIWTGIVCFWLVASSATAATEVHEFREWFTRHDQYDAHVPLISVSDSAPALVDRDPRLEATWTLLAKPLVLTMPVKPPRNVQWEEPPTGWRAAVSSVGKFIADVTRPSGFAPSSNAADAAGSPVMLVFLVAALGAGVAKVRSYSA